MAAYIATTYQCWMRWQHRFNRRLRCGTLCGLVLVFAIAVFGPLACIIHCSLIDALYPAQVHHAHHHNGQQAIGTAETAPDHLLCQFTGHSGRTTHTPLAQALYEMLPTMVVLMSISYFRHVADIVLMPRLPWRTDRPPLRPPRSAS